MAEDEAIHARILDRNLVVASVVRGYVEQGSAIVFSLVLIARGTYLIINDHDKAGVAVVVASLTPVLGAFLGARSMKVFDGSSEPMDEGGPGDPQPVSTRRERDSDRRAGPTD